MPELENAVAAALDAAGGPADNAQENATPSGTSDVTFEELMQDGAQDGGGQTAETQGDGGPDGEQTRGGDRSEKDKFESRIRAALDSQRKGFARDVDFAAGVRKIAEGMSDADILEAVREHQARRMHEADPDISEKAARQIIREREQKPAPAGKDVEAYKRGIEQLIEDGWTREELTGLVSDEAVRADLAAGATLRKAAKAFLTRSRQSTGQTAGRRTSVPTARNTAAGTEPESERIAQMSDAEFDRFSKRARQAMMEGKHIRL